MSKSPNKTAKPYIVSIVQDLSECAEVQVDATSSAEAEEIVSVLLRQGKLNKLDYTRGHDQGDPYITTEAAKLQAMRGQRFSIAGNMQVILGGDTAA